MKKAVLVLTNCRNVFVIADADYIGVDKGALILLENGIIPKLSIGDFDSVSEEELTMIANASENIEVFDSHKDYSDCELAVLKIYEQYDEIYLCGGLANRFDHAYANIMLLQEYPKLKIIDEQNLVYILDKGDHSIIKGNYTYISFFPLDDIILTLSGFEYCLFEKSLVKNFRLGLSNKIIAKEGKVISSGRLLVIQSNDL